MRVICVGGGAASFFFAGNVARMHPGTQVTILEQGQQVLGKVRISGGGRCNVTHHCYDPEKLVSNYPRGGSDLLKPFQMFGPADMVEWLAARGVRLKTESDGRMFPVSDRSQTIIDSLVQECTRHGVAIRTSSKVINLKAEEGGKGFIVHLLNGATLHADRLFVAPGGSKQFWQVLEHLGHTIVPPVPSLFTLQIQDSRLQGLAGISVSNVAACVPGTDIATTGPLLITHRGLSGPAILKMSAWGARHFHQSDYRLVLTIDFLPQTASSDVRQWRDSAGKKLLGNHQVSGLPRRLYRRLLTHAGLDPDKKFATLSNSEMNKLTQSLKAAEFHVTGQNRFKEEFVTAGGVLRDEIDFADFSSRLIPHMHLAGEVLDIDAVTGGFNFQAAWTGAYLAAKRIKM